MINEGSPDRGIIKNTRLIGVVEFGSTYGSTGLLSRKLYINHASAACVSRWSFTTSMSNIFIGPFSGIAKEPVPRRKTRARRRSRSTRTRGAGQLSAAAAAGATLRDAPHGHTSFTATRDRKSTRLNSSHANISYAVFCLKKK